MDRSRLDRIARASALGEATKQDVPYETSKE